MQTKHSAAVWALLVSVVLGPSYFRLQNGLYFDTMGLSYGIAKATSLTRLFKSGPHQRDKCPILASLLLWQSNQSSVQQTEKQWLQLMSYHFVIICLIPSKTFTLCHVGCSGMLKTILQLFSLAKYGCGKCIFLV